MTDTSITHFASSGEGHIHNTACDGGLLHPVMLIGLNEYFHQQVEYLLKESTELKRLGYTTTSSNASSWYS